MTEPRNLQEAMIAAKKKIMVGIDWETLFGTAIQEDVMPRFETLMANLVEVVPTVDEKLARGYIAASKAVGLPKVVTAVGFEKGRQALETALDNFTAEYERAIQIFPAPKFAETVRQRKAEAAGAATGTGRVSG